MAQLTVRLDDDLAAACRQEAEADGESLNGWVVKVLRVRTDPEYTGPGVERIRERFRRAGILAQPSGPPRVRPPAELVEEARRAGGGGAPSEQLVREDRDEGP